MKLNTCKYCRWNDNCDGNDSGTYPCPEYARIQEESLKHHD